MSVVAIFAFIVVLLAVGRFLDWRRMVPENAAHTLNLVVLNVCLPAAILLHAPGLEFRKDLIGLVAVPWIILLVTNIGIWPVARRLRLDRGATANLLLQVPLGNTSFIGYALIPVLVGASAMPYAVVYDQLGSFLILTTWGLLVVAWFGGGDRPTPLGILRRVIGFPPFIALVLALTIMPAQPGQAVSQGLQLLADALLPIVVLALGMQLRLRLPGQHRLPLVLGLVAKLLLMPLIAFGLCRWFELPAEISVVAVYLTAMPPMMTSGALLSSAGLAPELASALVGYGIVASMLTLPLWHWILGA
ncbi:AEC family transporter [Dokdonella sp.]|uniref:AEC family transporter n=1 Tax=Dokdonella sp. TaxID=2291710 RepID=UPI00352711D1